MAAPLGLYPPPGTCRTFLCKKFRCLGPCIFDMHLSDHSAGLLNKSRKTSTTYLFSIVYRITQVKYQHLHERIRSQDDKICQRRVTKTKCAIQDVIQRMLSIKFWRFRPTQEKRTWLAPCPWALLWSSKPRINSRLVGMRHKQSQ